jgi:hypothetical protein
MRADSFRDVRSSRREPASDPIAAIHDRPGIQGIRAGTVTFRDTDEPVLGLMGEALVFEKERFHRLVANLLLHCAEVSFAVFSNWYRVA